MTVKVNYNHDKLSLRIILHLDQPVVGFLKKRWLQA